MSELTRSRPDPHSRPGRNGRKHLYGRGCDESPDGIEALQEVLTMRARVDEAGTAAFLRRSLREIRAHIDEQGLEVAGPPFSRCHTLPGDIVDVEAGWPVRFALGTESIHAGTIPARQLTRHAICRRAAG